MSGLTKTYKRNNVHSGDIFIIFINNKLTMKVLKN